MTADYDALPGTAHATPSTQTATPGRLARPTTTAPRAGDTLTTAEQLDALPSLAIVIDANDEVQQRHGHLSTERGDYSAWLGVMPPTCKPSPDVALPVTVLYVPGEQPADRPSVTDNARAEAAAALRSTVDLDPRSDFDRGYAHGWHAAAEWAADRAETTTATTDEAVGELLERMSDAVTRLEALRAEHWDAPERQRLHGKIEGVKLAASYVEEARGLLATARTVNVHPTYTVEYQRKIADELGVEREAVLRALGLAAPLLATARTHPTRDDLARAIASGYEPDHPTPNRHDYRAADAVLALLRDGAR